MMNNYCLEHLLYVVAITVGQGGAEFETKDLPALLYQRITWINGVLYEKGFNASAKGFSPESVFTNHSLERSLSCSPDCFYI